MANKYIDSEWKDNLIGKDESRIYIDPRGLEYPPFNEDDITLTEVPPQKEFNNILNGGFSDSDFDYIDGGSSSTDYDYYDGGDSNI